MLKIWVGHNSQEGWKWAQDTNIAKQLIELYWQDQWEAWYIDNVPQEQIENKCIISLPYFDVVFLEWLYAHKASANYEVVIRGGKSNGKN